MVIYLLLSLKSNLIRYKASAFTVQGFSYLKEWTKDLLYTKKWKNTNIYFCDMLSSMRVISFQIYFSWERKNENFISYYQYIVYFREIKITEIFSFVLLTLQFRNNVLIQDTKTQSCGILKLRIIKFSKWKKNFKTFKERK